MSDDALGLETVVRFAIRKRINAISAEEIRACQNRIADRINSEAAAVAVSAMQSVCPSSMKTQFVVAVDLSRLRAEL